MSTYGVWQALGWQHCAPLENLCASLMLEGQRDFLGFPLNILFIFEQKLWHFMSIADPSMMTFHYLVEATVALFVKF